MEEKLDRIEKNIKDLTDVVGTLVKKTAHIEETVGTLVKKTAHIEETVDVLARSVAEGFEGMQKEFATKADMNIGFEQVNGKIEGLHRRMDAELEQKRVLGDRVSKIEVKVFPALAK
jgi:uncharacterized protein YoxC